MYEGMQRTDESSTIRYASRRDFSGLNGPQSHTATKFIITNNRCSNYIIHNTDDLSPTILIATPQRLGVFSTPGITPRALQTMSPIRVSKTPHDSTTQPSTRTANVDDDTRSLARLGGNGDFDIHTGLNSDLGDLLDDGGGSLQVDDTLVDAHLVAVPGLGTLTVGGLSGGDLKNLGGHAHGTLLDQLVLDGVADDVSANVLQLLDLGGSQGDSDLVDQLLLLLVLLFLSDGGGHDYWSDVTGEKF